MESSAPTQPKKSRKILICCLCLAGTLGLGSCLARGLLRDYPPTLFMVSDLTAVALSITLCLFPVVAVLMFFRPRWALFIALFTSVVGAYYFFKSEAANSPWFNSWIVLNSPDEHGWERSMILLAESKIAAISVMILLAPLSTLMLLPTHWRIRNKALNQRVWPAFAIAFVILSVWFVNSVVPYRIPAIVDASWPDVIIVHIKKEGLQLHETRLAIDRDRRFYISRNNRRLFQYRFEATGGEGELPVELLTEMVALPQLNQPQSPKIQAKPLRSWNAEGWYILGRKGIWTYTTEYGTKPPEAIERAFSDAEKLPVLLDSKTNLKDVCLGFCYDPIAALGFIYSNNRCNNYENGTARCW